MLYLAEGRSKFGNRWSFAPQEPVLGCNHPTPLAPDGSYQTLALDATHQVLQPEGSAHGGGAQTNTQQRAKGASPQARATPWQLAQQADVLGVVHGAGSVLSAHSQTYRAKLVTP
jgi:hypothetical protein